LEAKAELAIKLKAKINTRKIVLLYRVIFMIICSVMGW
jgi:hypothetical protein